MEPPRWTLYQANCFVTTSCIQSCSTQTTSDQKWWQVWSRPAKEGNTILKTNMNERGLQSTACRRAGEENAPTGYVALLQNMVQAWACGSSVLREWIWAYLHSLWIWGRQRREGKSSCGLMPQTATATGGLRPEQGSRHFSAGDTVLSQGWHIPEDLHFYSAYLWFVSHGSFLHIVCPARTLCKDTRAPRLLHPSPSRCTGAPGSQRLPVPRPEGSGTLPALTAAREWLVWKLPLLSEECIKAICCAARALLRWHLNKHSTGQRLHRVTPSLPSELCSMWN